ncbi:tRNA (guanine-N(7)-)-methyltransferase non-catalytic subunit trm82 [Cryptotrichosporon argae]
MSVPYPILSAVANPTSLVLAAGPSIHILDLDSQTLRSSESTGSVVRVLAVSGEGLHAVGSTEDKQLIVWDLSALAVKSTRHTTKKVACLSFDAQGDIVVTDKTADVYRYPLEPREVVGERPQGLALLNDPYLNPDADLLLGHVSVITQHLLAAGGTLILTADRDEHIRVSRYPRSYVIERILHLAEGFTSAMHIPQTRPNLLLSAGSDDLHLFAYQSSHLPIASIPIAAHVKPHRRIRPTERRQRGKKPGAGTVKPSENPRDEGWYIAPEGTVLPLGDGVCVAGIESVQSGADTLVAFFSLGCAAVHSFTLPDPAQAADTILQTLPLAHPVIGLTHIAEARFLVMLDTAWSALKCGKKEATTDEIEAMRLVAIVVEITADGPVLVESPMTAAFAGLPTADAKTISALQLYTDLSLLPRWPGLEEDDELAGDGSETPGTPGGSDDGARGKKGRAKAKAKGRIEPADVAGMSQEELKALDLRQLGYLKARGVDVGELTSRKKRKIAANERDRAKAREGKDEPSAGVDEEAALNV